MAKVKRPSAVGHRPSVGRRSSLPGTDSRQPAADSPLPLWLWPLVGALLVAPLKAAQLDPMPVAAVNTLLAAAVLLAALRPEPLDTEREPGAAGRLWRSWSRDRVTLCLGLFVALNLLSLAVSIYLHATLTALLDLAALFSAYLLLAHAGSSRRAIPWVLGALLAAGVMAAAMALREYGLEAWKHPHPNPGWRAFGPFFSPNLLAAMAILLAPVALALLLRTERPVERLGAGAATLLFVTALLVSGSRGGALGLAAGGAAFIVVAAARGLRLDRRRALALAGLALALLPLLWVFRVPMLGRLAHVHGTPALIAGSPEANASERSNAFRRLIWKATVRIIRSQPLLGTGAGTFEFALPRYSSAGYTQMAHESYLQIAAETGVPALLAWLCALCLALARLVSPRRGPPDWLLPGIAGGLVAAMAHNLVDYSWSVMGTALPFWALLGAAVALTSPGPNSDEHGDHPPARAPEARREATGQRGNGANEDHRTPSTSRTTDTDHRAPERLNARRLALGAAGALLLGLNAAWLQAAEHQARAQAAVANQDASAAVDEYQAAVALMPMDARLQQELAGVEAATGDKEAAAAAYRRAAALAPTWGQPHYRLGRLLEASGQPQAAAAELARAAALDPRSTQPLVALAEVLEAQGRHPAALAVYRRIVALEGTVSALDEWTDPNPAVAHEALGQEAEARGDRGAAIRDYRLAAERLRRWRRELPFRSAIQQAQGENFTERNIDVLRRETRLWQWLADLYTKSGQPQAAAEARQEAAAAQAATARAEAPGGSPAPVTAPASAPLQ